MPVSGQFFFAILIFNFFIFPTKNRVFVILLHYLYYSFIVFTLIVLIFSKYFLKKSCPIPASIHTTLTH